MKKLILSLLINIAGSYAYADSSVPAQSRGEGKEKQFSPQSSVVNNLDSVVFDLSQAVDTLGYVYFPVSILSDDSIYALDFSFKYNHTKLIFDSIIDLTNYIQFLSYYNGADSVVRFTCNSLQRYTNDTALVLIRFITLGGPIINSDLNTIDVYLNGTLCSLKFVSSLINETEEIKNAASKINIYPNPANEVVNIYTDQKSSVQLSDLKGRILYTNSELYPGNTEIDSGNLENGIYLLVIRNQDIFVSKQLIISR